MKRFFAAVCLLLSWSPWAPAQDELPPIQERPFMLSRDRELESLVQQAEELLARGRPDAAALLVGRILRARPTEAVVPVDLDRSEGLLTRVRRILRRLPPDQASALEEAVRPEAEPLLERGLARRDPELLFEVATHFPTTRFANQARDALARLALEQGQADEAGAWFRRTLEEEPDSTHAAIGLALVRALHGRRLPPLPEGIQAVLTGEKKDSQELRRYLASLPPLLSDPRPWSSFGGASRLMASPTHHKTLTWEHPLEGPDDPMMDSVLHPVTDGTRVFLCAGGQALALDLFTGRRLWSHHAAPPPRKGPPRGRLFGLRTDERPAAPPEGLALAGTLVGRLFICPLEVGRLGSDSQYRSIRITTSLPIRRLHAFDANTGELVWRHYSHETEALRELGAGWNVAGPPLASGQRVFVASVDYGQTISAYVSCFEVDTGRLLWRTRICSGQMQLNMFGNPTREFAASPLTLEEGLLFGSTNLGVVFALEAHTGEVRWLGFYESSRPPDMHFYDHFRPQQRTLSPFGANAPLVLGDEVLFAPSDSETAFALARADGALRWNLPARPTLRGTAFELRHVLGELDGEIYFQGNGVLAIDPKRRRGRGLLGTAFRVVLTPERLGAAGIQAWRLPRGGLAPDTIYTINQFSGLCLWDLQGSASPVMNTSRDLGGRLFGRDAIRVGNLLAGPGVLLTTGNRLISGFLSLEHIVTRAEQELLEKPHDPDPFLTLASVLLHRDQPGDLERAEEILERATRLPEATGEAGVRVAATLRKVLLARVGTLLAQGEVDTAEAVARRAVEVSRPGETDLEARLLLADILESLGKTDAWRQEAQAILSLYQFEQFRFTESEGPTRVGPRLLVRLALSEPDDLAGATRAVAWWRRLLESFSADRVQGRTGRDLAAAEIAALLARHGREIYAAWENKASALLERALREGDPELLRRIVQFFPNSQAATRALRLLVDQAAEEGDLVTLLEEVIRAGQGRLHPGFLQRLAEASLQAGNPWLARALFARLTDFHGETLAEFGPDKGKRLAEVARLRTPAPPAPGELSLAQLPVRRQRVELPSSPGRSQRLLRPVTWGTPSSDDPLLFVSGEQIWAVTPAIEEVLVPRWLGALPSPPRTYFPTFRFEDHLVLCCHSSIAIINLQDGILSGGLDLPPGGFPRNFLAREGLVLSSTERSHDQGETLEIQALEPFSGALWGAQALHSGPGAQSILLPGPEQLIVVTWHEEGGGRQRVQARLEITAIDPLTMSATRLQPPGSGVPLPLDLPLGRRTCLATASHLILPLLDQGRSLLRALPLVEGAADWELELPQGEQLVRLAPASGGRLGVLAFRGNQGILRILQARTGAELRQVLLGPQALLLHPMDENDPWATPPGPFLLALSGSNPRARTLHICDVERDSVGVVVLSGDGFTSGSPLTAPVFGPDLVALVLRQSPSGSLTPGLTVYLVDTAKGLLLGRHPGLVGSYATPEMLAAGTGLLVLASDRALGVLEPE